MISCAKRMVIVALSLVLAACHTIPKPDPSKTADGWLDSEHVFAERLAWAQAAPRWSYAAKVGLTGPEVREQANLRWQYSDQANSLRLFGPLGVGAVRIEFDQYGVVLSDNKGVLHRGNNAEELLSDIVGWHLPVDALRYWLFATPAPGAVYRYKLLDGNVSEFEQLGWSIQFSAYKSFLDGAPLMPRKIIANKTMFNSAGEQTFMVKLISKRFSVE